MSDLKEEFIEELHFGSESFDNQVYYLVTKSAALRDVCLVDSVFSARVEEVRLAQINDDPLNNSFGEEPPDISFDQESGIAIGKFKWTVEICRKREKLLRLKAQFVVVYSGLEECEAQYVYLYVHKVGRFASYPYFRSHFATQAASAGVMLPPLPALTDRID